MAIEFPASPVDGQFYPTVNPEFVYNASKTRWDSLPLEGAKTITSDTAPSGVQDGDQWFNTTTGVLYIWVVDTDGGQWVESVAPISANGYYSPNYIINGGFDIWQRGTSFSNVGSTAFSADRWRTVTTTLNSNITQDTSTPSAEFKYSYKAVPASNGTPSGEWVARQVLEQQNVFHLAGKTVTLSFWYRSTKTSGKARVSVSNNTGGTDVAQTFTVVANTWTKIVLQFSSFANVTAWTGSINDWGGFVDIGFADATPLTTSDNFYITGVQLEAGSTATTFRRSGNSIQGELAACQRYYEKSYDLTTAPGTVTEVGVHRHSGSGNAAGRHYVPIRFKVEKRTNAYTVTTYNPTAANSSWITVHPAQAGIARTPDIEQKGTSGMTFNVEDGGYSWYPGNTRGHWTVEAEL